MLYIIKLISPDGMKTQHSTENMGAAVACWRDEALKHPKFEVCLYSIPTPKSTLHEKKDS